MRIWYSGTQIILFGVEEDKYLQFIYVKNTIGLGSFEEIFNNKLETLEEGVYLRQDNKKAPLTL